ncbi:fasciclin domain-containing protein [Vitellibacter sp. q18]|nr:fasciclin domain-containing protein [Aequorivita lutea]
MLFKNSILILLFLCFVIPVSAQKYLSTDAAVVSKNLGNSTFTSNKSFYDNIVDAPDFTIMAQILKTDGSRKNLESQEMVTFFAISDEAFLKFNKETRDSILGNPMLLKGVINFLAVPGRLDSHALKTEIAKKGGPIYIKTLSGEQLGVRETDGQLQLFDSENRTATVIAKDFYHKNGFFHIIDALIFPR